MKIILKSVGDLRDYFGRDPHEIELPENATLQDLLQTIDKCWGQVLPSYLWDSQKICFRGPVFLMVDKKVLEDPDTTLREGREVTVVRALSGG